jgi:alginate O-acetyltransferase complex protein AlgI
MLFNSLTFVLVFLPVALIGYYGFASLSAKWAGVWLVTVSFIFYSWWGASLVFLLGGSIAFNFLSGLLILRARQRESLQTLLLAFGIGGDLILLFYYKYFFALLNWLGLHGLVHISHPYSMVLPLGVSFFTFTQIGYLVDCKGGVVQTNRLLDYCLFVTFFPHLIAGPILHHREMMPQFANPETYRPHARNLAVGATLFILGLAKKVVIADYFVGLVSGTYSHVPTLSFSQAWEGVLAYSLQLYFDFSGYSDMAIGLALLFGMRFPANFDSPYRAASIIDYWQRFHMTLTRYITQYVFSPIALWVSRYRAERGLSISKKALATVDGFFMMIVLPTMITMALAGVWHGAGLQFLIFGLLHGVYLIINHAWRSFGPRVPATPPHPVLRLSADGAKIALTFAAVLLAQVFFRSSSTHDALSMLRTLVGLPGHPALVPGGPHFIAVAAAAPAVRRGFSLPHSYAILILFAIVWTMPNSLQMLSKYEPTLSKLRSTSLIKLEWKPNLVWGVIVGLIAALSVLEMTGLTEFLYFRF